MKAFQNVSTHTPLNAIRDQYSSMDIESQWVRDNEIYSNVNCEYNSCPVQEQDMSSCHFYCNERVRSSDMEGLNNCHITLCRSTRNARQGK